MNSPVRVRFAPSPTGKVHIGNVRTAIFNCLFARHHGGKFLLRIEDTDRERSTPEAEKVLLECLEWLDLDWDAEGPEGAEGFLRQSVRSERYQQVVDDWLEKGIAYRSDKATGTSSGASQAPQSATGEAIWFKAPREDVEYDDLILGKQKQPRRQVQDFVIVRSNGRHMFILANAIDDVDMGITHVLRGVDHKTNTFRQVMLYRALGAEAPRFGHMPLIVERGGKKLSKREDDPESIVFVQEFRERGYLPEALFNFLALLGWSPKPVEQEDGETLFREKLSRDELIVEFDLNRVKASPAQFDIVKLGAMNYRYILDRLDADPGMLIDYLKQDVAAEGLDAGQFSAEQYTTLIREAGSRVRTLKELARNNRYFFTDSVEVQADQKNVKKVFRKEGVWERVKLVTEALESISESEWNRENTLTALHKLAEKHELKLGDVAQPVRVLTTGSTASPPIDITLELLGRQRTLGRLQSEESRSRLERTASL